MAIEFCSKPNDGDDATPPGQASQHAIQDWRELKALLKKMMPHRVFQANEKGLMVYVKGSPRNAQKIDTASLSEGEKHQLGYALYICRQGLSYSGSIMLLDEPEHHLHPDACLRVTNQLIDLVGPQGQVWIATHLLPLIASILETYNDEVSLYFMQVDPESGLSGGQPKMGGQTPSQVMESLMGGGDNIEALRRLLDLPITWQMADMSSQLLSPSGVKGHGVGTDPQALGIWRALWPEAEGSSGLQRDELTILDFGAGRGRLLRCWRSAASEIYKECADRTNYFAYDIHDTHRDECNRAIQAFYNETPSKIDRNRFILGSSDLLKFSEEMSRQVDAVLLCNVLHEIDPREWVALFGPGSAISKMLHQNGQILIVEDLLMRDGEYNHPFGFLLMDTESLGALFGLPNNNMVSMKIDYREDSGRIGVFLIPAVATQNVTQDSCKKALHEGWRMAGEKVEKAWQEIHEERQLDLSAKNRDKLGRRHALWALQFINFRRASKLAFRK